MARTDSLSDFLTDIADSIRTKKGTTEAISASDFDTEISAISGSAEPNLQSKSISITENGTQSVTPDTGYDGLSSVNVTTNVATGGDLPTIGFIVNKWNSSGYPTEITTIGSLMAYYFANKGASSSYSNGLSKYLNKVIIQGDNIEYINNYLFYENISINTVEIPSSVTSIGMQSFYGCTSLKNINLENINTINSAGFSNCQSLLLDNLPSGLSTINLNSFYNCKKISIKKIPDKVTSIGPTSFYSCNSIIQLSMNNVESIYGNSNTNGSFYNCTGLIAVWIGSAITSSGFNQYSFKGCTNLTKIFIDLPRSTVEAFTNYQYAFMGDTTKTGIIICNDDEGFMTKDEFDAIDWANQ